MSERSNLFQFKLRQHHQTLTSMSKRYTIRGVLDPEDLYQEGLCLLDKLIRAYFEEGMGLDPLSDDFDRYLVTALRSTMVDQVRRCKASNRDCRCTSLVSDLVTEGETFVSAMERICTADNGSDPERDQVEEQERVEVRGFLADLVDDLPLECLPILQELLYPSDLRDDERAAFYQREQSKPLPRPPVWLIGYHLGLSRSQVRGRLTKIREVADSLLPLYDFATLFTPNA